MKFVLTLFVSFFVFNISASTVASCEKGFMGYVMKLHIFEEADDYYIAKVATRSTVVDHSSVIYRGEVLLRKFSFGSETLAALDLENDGESFALKVKKQLFSNSFKGTLKLDNRLIKNMNCKLNL